MKQVTSWLFFGMWMLVPILCSAQQNNQDVVFSRITTDQGLSSNRVNATVQDAEGYLWVATGNGLNRYDGYEVKEYLHDPEDSLTIAANEVLSVFLDRDDDLWVVGRNSGISRYERKQDRFQRFISDLPINSLVEDGRGQLWVLGEGVAGILNKATGAFTNYAKNYNASLFMHAASGQLPNELWMATAFDGLLLVDVDTKAALKHIRHEPGVPGLSSSRLFTVHAGKHHLWIGTYDSGLDALNFRTQTYANYRHRPNVANALQVNAVTSVLEWGDSLWIGTQNGGLSRLALSTQELVSFLPDKQNPNSISSSSIAHATGLYRDRANRLVIATHFGGVNVIDPQNQIFQNLEADGYTVNAVLKDTRGRLWMATENGIVQVHQRTQKKYLQYPVLCFKQDALGRVWAGTYQHGLLLFDEAKSDFRAFVHNPQEPASISVNEIWSLEQSLDGTQLIIGTRHGVSLMQLNKPGTFVNLLGNKCPDTGGPIFYYLQTLQTDTNTAWFATVNGLARLNLATRTWQCVTTDPANGRSISSNLTTVLFSDSQKRLWVGTKDGLNLMKPNGTFQRWSRKNGLASDIINGIAEDERGRLWIATSNGISELNPTTGRIRNYSELDGLKSKEFKQGAFHQEGGFIYFGHAGGVTRFNPIQSGELKDVPSEVFITDLKIFNESVRVGEFDSLLRQNIRYTQRVKIRHDQSVVTLDFAGIHYAHPEKVQYAYQLVGADRDWVKAGTRRSVTYSHLPPDTYTFRVRVSTGNEAWNPKEATLTLEVLPPWWKTWWARTGAGVGIVLIFFGLVRYRTRQAVAQRRELAQLVKSRTLELQASRDKYENLVDNIPVGVYTVKKTVDNQYQFLYASPVFCETNGLSEEEIKKDFAASLKNIHPDDLPGFLAANQQSADTDQPFVWEGRMVVNGQTKYLHTESGPRQCLDGSTEWNGIQYEITDRKLAELELQRVYSQRQLILDNVPANIFCKDRTGKFLFVNRLMAEMYGQTPAELIAAKPRDVKHTPEQLGRYHAEDVYVLETGKPLFIPKEEFVRADGSTGIFQTIKVPLQLDEQSGSVVLGISVEITDRVKIENELARVKQILEQTNQLARVGGWEYDFRAKQVFWTEVMYDIHELPLNDHVDARSATKFIFAEEDRAMVTRSMQLLVNEREVFDHELRIKTAKGNVRWVRVFAEGQWDEMGCVRVFGAFQDIDLIKQTEAALREARLQAETASAAKSEFLASMSHEIRTPLNGVIGFTDILAKTGLTETQQHYVATVSQSAHALLDIINDILDFSKIEAGKLELAVERVDLPLLMQQAVDIVKYQAHKKGLELLLHIPANVPRFLFVDEVRLRQILVNLLSNAVKFTDQGDIELKVVLREADLQRGHRLTFSVRDTGIGIKASNQHKIFEEFAQEDNSTTKRFGGTGLGLAISNRLLALMGSRLGLSSVPGHGSTFWFDVWMESESVAAQVEEFGNQRQVLVIDNHPTARQILTELVTDVGIKVREAASGPEAVALFQAGTRFDAILIDYHMPGMDGITTIQKIRSLPGVPHVPVILFYSSADSEFIDDLCDQMGIRFRVMKPALRQPVYTLLANAWREAIPEQAVRVHPTIHSTTEKAIRILVAEDNPVNLLLVKSMLESAYPHAEVVEALNGKEAVSQFQRCNPNIVFMDVRMPDVSGFEATRMIRTWEAGRTRVPIVALTAGTAQADREKALEAGMDDYLSKPVVQSVFLNTLRKWLGKSEKPTVARVPPFDLSDLRARLGFSDAALQQLVRVALASATETVDEIEKCWKNSRVDGWQEAAHKLKGVAMNAAFLQLAQLAAEMEEIEPRAVDRYLMEQKLRDMRAALTSLHTQVANAFARP